MGGIDKELQAYLEVFLRAALPRRVHHVAPTEGGSPVRRDMEPPLFSPLSERS